MILSIKNTPSDADLRAVANKFLTLLKELQSSKKWEKVDDKPVIVSRLYIEERVVVRAQNTMNLSFEAVTKFLIDPNMMKKISDRCLEFEILHQGDGFSVFHAHMKGIAMVSDRQLVAVSTFYRESDTKIYIGNRICDYPCKPYEDTVPAFAHCGGLIVQKVDQNKTRVINIADMDPSGSIPGFVKNKLATLRASEFAELQRIIKASLK